MLHTIVRASAKLMILSIRWDKAIEATQHRKFISLGPLDSRTAQPMLHWIMPNRLQSIRLLGRAGSLQAGS